MLKKDNVVRNFHSIIKAERLASTCLLALPLVLGIYITFLIPNTVASYFAALLSFVIAYLGFIGLEIHKSRLLEWAKLGVDNGFLEKSWKGKNDL